MQAVLDAPTEDAPRAAYARAIAASDPERAELIDIQLELARARRAHTEGGPPSLHREGTLILLAEDYDGGHKAWVRWPDGSDDIVPGSQVQRGDS